MILKLILWQANQRCPHKELWNTDQQKYYDDIIYFWKILHSLYIFYLFWPHFIAVGGDICDINPFV